MGISIFKLLGLENSKSVTPSQVAAFLMRKFPLKGDLHGGVVGVSILKLLGLENSKTVTPSQVAAFLIENSLKRVICRGKGGGSLHFAF